MSDLPEGMKALRDELAEAMRVAECGEGAPEEYWTIADALLAPDGPLFPALRALGLAATDSPGWGMSWLADMGITGALADACLAAAEVEL